MGVELLLAATSPVGIKAYEIREEREASKDQKRAREAERRMQAIKMQRERRRQVREAQRIQAQTEAAAVATGTSKTSAVAQAQGSIQSQLASNLSFLDQMEQLTNKQSIFMQRAADHQRRAGTAGSIFDLQMKAVSMFAGGA